jgi:hypothetical protein
MSTTASEFRRAVEGQDMEAGIALLAEDVVFRSPVVFKPYEGREAVGYLLRFVAQTFEDFRYIREIGTPDSADHLLEFVARVGDKEVNGVDIIHVGDDGLIDDFTVMVRPMSGMLALAESMKAKLEAAGAA